MNKVIKNMFLKVAQHYAKDRFLEVDVHQNPFGPHNDLDNSQKPLNQDDSMKYIIRNKYFCMKTA